MNGSKTFTVRQIWTRYHPFSGEIYCTCRHYMLWTFVNKRTIVWDNSCNPCCQTIARFKYFLFLLSTIIIHSGGCFPLVLTTVKSQDIFVRLITLDPTEEASLKKNLAIHHLPSSAHNFWLLYPNVKTSQQQSALFEEGP